MNEKHSGNNKPADPRQSRGTEPLHSSKDSTRPAGCEQLDSTRPAGESSTQPAPPSSETRQQSDTDTIIAGDATDETSPIAPVRWHIGDVILDLYAVKDIFDTGGTATVYRVRHRTWGRDLAVKTPKPGILKAAGGIENFVHEAETWVNLGLHPHIVSCYYVRLLDGIPFVFAEFINGGSVFDHIQSRHLYRDSETLSLKRILDIAIQCAWGLQFAHRQGLIHQDVKPANIMITGEGLVKVTDFGLAKACVLISALPRGYGDNIVATCGGMTPAYCSPEQAAIVAQAKQGVPQQKRGKLTPATDIWSWAVSVLEMFTGGVTWQNGKQAADIFHTLKPGQPVAEGLPPMPAKIAALLSSCLSPNPTDRPFFDHAVDTLRDVYRSTAKSLYPRPDPESAQPLADNLNNRGVSLIDLCHPVEALECFNRALALHPDHPDAAYNKALIQWRSGSISDAETVRSIEEMRHANPPDSRNDMLLACIEIERGDYETGLKLCEQTTGNSTVSQHIKDLVQAARDRKNLTRTCIQTFEGHANAVNALHIRSAEPVLFSGSGSPFAFAREKDFSIRMWNAETGALIRTFTGHGGKITEVCCDHSGTRLLSTSVDGTLKLWNALTGECIHTLSGHEAPVESACLSDDGTRAASGGRNGTVLIWDIYAGRCTHTLKEHEDTVAALCWIPDGSHLISAGRDGAIKIRDVRSLTCTNTLTGHTGGITSLSAIPGAGIMLSGSSDTTIKLWSLQNGSCLKTFTGHAEAVTAVCLSPTGKYFLSGGGSFFGREWVVKLWETDSGRCLYTFTGHTGKVTSVCLSPDGLYAFSGSEDTTIKKWRVDITSSTLWAPMSLSQLSASEDAFKAHRTYEHQVAKAHEAIGEHLAEEAKQHLKHARAQKGYERSPEALSVWFQLYRQLPKGDLKGAWEELALKEQQDAVTSICLRGDGLVAASGSEQGVLTFRDINACRCLARVEAHSGSLYALCSAGDRFISGAGDGIIKVWAPDFTCTHTLKKHKQSIYALAAAQDNGFFVSGCAGGLIKLWNSETGEYRQTLDGHAGPVTSLRTSPDGMCIISGSRDSTIRIWDSKNGKCLRIFEERRSPVTSLDISSDGAYVVTGHADCSVKLWEMETGSCLRTIHGHTAPVTAVRISLDRHFAVSGSDDGTMRIWNLNSGTELRVFEGHEYGVSAIDIASPGHRVISGGKDAAVKLWLLDWDLETPKADSRDKAATQNLKPETDPEAAASTDTSAGSCESDKKKRSTLRLDID